MLDAQELGTTLRTAKRSLFRLELQAAYDVPADGNDFQRFLAGESGPDMGRKQRWLDFLREQRTQGIYRHRVRALRTPLSEYDRYAAAWGYSYNVPAGDDTRILDVAAHPLQAWIDHDFWLIDDQIPVRMHYDETGQFTGAEVVESRLPTYRVARDVAWTFAEPFEQWWHRQPEYRTAQVVN
jgi:hypothetical protein